MSIPSALSTKSDTSKPVTSFESQLTNSIAPTTLATTTPGTKTTAQNAPPATSALVATEGGGGKSLSNEKIGIIVAIVGVVVAAFGILITWCVKR